MADETPLDEVARFLTTAPLTYWEKVQDPRIPCPTCDGIGIEAIETPSGGCHNRDCEDCNGTGIVPLAKLIAIGAVVMDCSQYTDGSDAERGGSPHWDNIHTPVGDITTAADFLGLLQAVKP